MEKEMTKKQWRDTHHDFKTVINGKKYVLEWVDGKGTCLVPVKIVEEKTVIRGE